MRVFAARSHRSERSGMRAWHSRRNISRSVSCFGDSTGARRFT